MSVSNTHGEQPTVVMSSVPYSCKSQCHISTGMFPALTEGISVNTLQQHSTVPQQTFSTVATLQGRVTDTYRTVLTDRTGRKEEGDKLQENGQRDGKNSMRIAG